MLMLSSELNIQFRKNKIQFISHATAVLSAKEVHELCRFCKRDHLLLSNVESMRGSAKCLGCNSVLVLNER